MSHKWVTTTWAATCLATADEVRVCKNMSHWGSPSRCIHWRPGLKSPSKQGQGHCAESVKVVFPGDLNCIGEWVGRWLQGRSEVKWKHRQQTRDEKGKLNRSNGDHVFLILCHEMTRWWGCWNCPWSSVHVQRWDYVTFLVLPIRPSH